MGINRIVDEYGSVIIAVLVIAGFIAIVTLFFNGDSNSSWTISSIFSGMLETLSNYGDSTLNGVTGGQAGTTPIAPTNP